MSKIYILLIFLFSMCSSTKRIPNYNEKELIPCLKKDDIKYNKYSFLYFILSLKKTFV